MNHDEIEAYEDTKKAFDSSTIYLYYYWKYT
jgi:hypothetical protein